MNLSNEQFYKLRVGAVVRTVNSLALRSISNEELEEQIDVWHRQFYKIIPERYLDRSLDRAIAENKKEKSKFPVNFFHIAAAFELIETEEKHKAEVAKMDATEKCAEKDKHSSPGYQIYPDPQNFSLDKEFPCHACRLNAHIEAKQRYNGKSKAVILQTEISGLVNKMGVK